eukprot:scaffold16490_cov73-Phaeocystis_antarctica.AAC.5
MVPDSVRVDPSARDSARTTRNISTSVPPADWVSCCPGCDRGVGEVGRRTRRWAPPAGPPADGVLGAEAETEVEAETEIEDADVCRRAAVVCSLRPPAPSPHQRHSQGWPERAGNVGCSAARAPTPHPTPP